MFRQDCRNYGRVHYVEYWRLNIAFKSLNMQPHDERVGMVIVRAQIPSTAALQSWTLHGVLALNCQTARGYESKF